MFWCLSHRADPRALPLADRHYNRQKPGTSQFVPPGRCLVLLTPDARALWVTSWPLGEYVRHRWPGAWICSAFRREDGPPASDLIRDAVAATRWRYGEPPSLGMVTFIDRDHVRPTRVRGRDVWGWTWLRAGFEPAAECAEHAGAPAPVNCAACRGETEGGLLALRLRPERMPGPLPPIGAPLRLFGSEVA